MKEPEFLTRTAPGSGVVVASKTLTPGGSATISGTIYSLPISGTVPIAVSTESGTTSRTSSEVAPAEYTGRASKDGVSILAELSALMIWMAQILFIM